VIGQRFGNYRAVSLLGEGGMGAVYLAEHPEIGRRVAVKVLRPELIRDPSLLTRFLNEARAANAIRHPNIIEVLDSGTTVDGVPYLVMELLEGESLSARIRRVGKVPLRDALEFSYQAASALAAAHAKGIVHRDLKPDNLFLVPVPSDPAREMIKVLDFGIAKLQTLPTGSGMQTRTGTLMGTPVYMSPEQCLGTKTVDHRSDIYALGIIMFEMLAGRPPFISDGFGELVNMHLNVRPPSLHDVNPAVTPPVELLILKALEKAPEARQRSATELQADIRAAAGKSIMLRGTSSPDLIAETLPGTTAGSTRIMPSGPLGVGSSTTISGGTGERFRTTAPVTRGRGVPFAIGGVVLALLAGGAWYAASRLGKLPVGAGRRATEADDPGKSPKAAAKIRLTLDTDPAGASVIDAASGANLGTTPMVLEQAPAPKPLSVRISKPGFATVTRDLDVGRDGHETFVLAAAGALDENLAEDRGGEKPETKPDKKPEKKSETTAHSAKTPPKAPKTPTKDRPTHHPRPAPGEEEPAKL
jgi:serine/threonine-protein kinase